ncbi:hypothetical protein M011DRAFT_467516 [Sporormia fimetaria CBS 119925]|uniref:Cell wall protein PhiA n=1 Tax=Sporormia fimetaria CBS 119925 TaxID=1340428 RepID=A0A6A6VCI5_9PLEO|nr:hypothetical protein M011DRAFT_467516 [Sporormia fimetaria CBS 119925]
MQLKNLALASVAATTSLALPATTSIADGTTFALITYKDGELLGNAGVQAALRSLFVNLPSQNATCGDNPDPNFATFYLNDQELNLFGYQRGNQQKIFVDRSGMGMGKIGYITGSEGLGRYWETQGWTLNDNQLLFKGTALQACPNSIDGGWSLWLQGVAKPGYNENCTPVVVTALETPDPIGCFYKN